ncbi:helix-turn-helix domain-containing protein [Mycobacteroides abscessus]|uniref:helix-turn-helix domain-containing protein n=1 Tax=Mycobacteroides abscessus TaxID=36809 RepID=UPI00092A89D1|nr:helix-turn-helix domain-containing protein [Mycobacteroides abscessus]SIN36493.1 DNA binding domain-containing protein [Mycobacteroides abscessus subsp. abscessus]
MRRMGYTEAAEIAGLSHRSIRSAVYAGELIARRCGRRVLIAEADLDAWLNAMPRVVAGDDIDDETDTDDIDNETEGDAGRPRAKSATRTRTASAADIRQEVAAA